MRYLQTLGILAAFSAGTIANSALAQDAKSIALYKGKDRLEKLIAGAKKEGQVTIYSSMIVDQALRPLADGFRKKYPFMKTKYLRENPPQLLQKLLSEARGKRRVADVLETTGLEVRARQANVIQPYYSPESEGYDKKWRDPSGYSSPTRFSYLGACYNKNLVKAADLPKSFEDFLNPKWKGKLVWAGTITGSILFITAIRNSMGEEKGIAYLKQLAKQNIITIPSSNRVVVDRVVAGEYPVCLDAFLHHPIISAGKGAPVASLPLNPVITLVSSVMLPKNVPHPYSAMLFIDYLLSKDGQIVLQKANYFPARKDVDASAKLNSIVPNKIGMKENFISPAVMTSSMAKSRELYKQLFVK